MSSSDVSLRVFIVSSLQRSSNTSLIQMWQPEAQGEERVPHLQGSKVPVQRTCTKKAVVAWGAGPGLAMLRASTHHLLGPGEQAVRPSWLQRDLASPGLSVQLLVPPDHRVLTGGPSPDTDLPEHLGSFILGLNHSSLHLG